MDDGGAVINGRYEILHDLGSGSQGRVFQVLDKLYPSRPTALKVLSDAPRRARVEFEFEFGRLALLEHPHLVRVYDFGTVASVTSYGSGSLAGAAFFTQELVIGESADIWASKLDLDSKERLVARVAVSVARALSMLHSRGLLHRDVKPSNILVDPEARSVKLIDLGLASEIRFSEGVRRGTFGYMAPESLAGFPGVRSDLYGLGVTMAQLLSGEPPRWGTRLPIEPPIGISKDLWGVVIKLSSDDSERRFATGSEVVLALGRALGAELLGDGREGELLDATSDAEDFHTRQAGVRSVSLVGRDDELSSLSKWLQEGLSDTSGCAQATVISGPWGIGKTRLVDSSLAIMQVRAAREMDVPVTVHRGTVEGIAGLAGVFDDSEGVGVEELFRGLTAYFSARLQPVVLHLYGETLDLNPEQIHWLSSCNSKKSVPLLVIAEMDNQVDAEGIAESEDALFLDLGSLSREDTAVYAAEIIGNKPSDEFIAELYRKTGGIPLLIESVFEAMPRGGVGLPASFKLSKLDVPQKREALVTFGSLARLDQRQKDIAAAVTVLRRVCIPEEIGEILQMKDSGETLDGIGHLLRLSLIRVCPDGGLETAPFAVKGITEQIPQNIRVSLNRAAFEKERAQASPEPELLARYAFDGEMPKEGLEFAVEASLRAESKGDFSSAVLLLELAFERVENLRDQVLKIRLAGLYRRTGRYENALELLDPLPENDRDLHELARLERAATWRLSGRSREALEEARSLVGSGVGSVSVEARAIVARMCLDAGDLTEAEKELGDFESVPEIEALQSGLLGVAGLVLLSKGETEKALGIFEKGLAASKRTNDRRQQVRFAALAGMTSHATGRYEDAARRFQDALRMAIKVGDRHGAAIYAGNIAAALTELDDFEGALSRYREGLNRLRLVGRFGELAQTGANYSQLLLRLGDIRGAKRAAERALAHAKRSDDTVSRGLALCVNGDVALEEGRTEDALELLFEAEKTMSDSGQTSMLEACRLNLAGVYLAIDNSEKAESWYRRALDATSGQEGVRSLGALEVALELALRGRGDPKKALEELVNTLPGPVDSAGLLEIGALSRAALGARKLGMKQLASNLARATVNVNAKLKSRIPHLYREGNNSLEIQMKEILGDHEYGRSSLSFPQTAAHLSSPGWERLARINTRLNSERKVGSLLDLIMDTALEVTEAQRGFLLLIDSKGNLRVRSARNMDREKLSSDQQDYSRSVAERAFSSGAPVMTTDAQEDDQFKGYGSVVSLDLQYIIAVPLMVMGEAQGTIYVDSRMGGRFDDERLKVLQALADQAAIALTNARLVSSIKQKQRKIERLNAKLKAQLHEREGELTKAQRDLEIHKEDLLSKYHFAGIIGHGTKMSEIFRLIVRVKDTDMPVVIGGESGTGKELVAKAIHYSGERKRNAFVAENCAAIPAQLLESQLFGHVKGAFTGATRDKPGLFIEASGGTLFLDEIGDMPLDMQTKLLRVLQEGEVRPVGGEKTVSVDVRIVVASNKNLLKLVKENQFREDLYYRLNVIELILPPLRERIEDIPALVEHFVSKHAKGIEPGVSQGAMEALMEYSWPGNVRQLENEIMRALVLNEGMLLPENLSDTVFCKASDDLADLSDLDMEKSVDHLKRRLVRVALKKSGGNRSRAALLLGISRYGLQKMLARWGE